MIFRTLAERTVNCRVIQLMHNNANLPEERHVLFVDYQQSHQVQPACVHNSRLVYTHNKQLVYYTCDAQAKDNKGREACVSIGQFFFL